MAITVSYGGRRALLAYILPYLGGLRLRLFVNDLVISADLGDDAFTEASFSGYAARQLRSWPSPYLNGQHYGESDFPRQDYRVSSAGGTDQVWGYYFTDVNGHWIAAELLAGGPVRMHMTGDTLSVSPRFLSGPLC